MRSNGFLCVGALLLAVSSVARAQDPKDYEKEKAAEAEKAKAQQSPAKVMVVPPASGSGTTTGPLNRANSVVLPTVPLKIAPTVKIPGAAATQSAPTSTTATAGLTIPYRTTTGQLGAVGTAAAVAAAATVEPFAPIRLTTGSLGAVGMGMSTVEGAPFSPIRVRTAPLGALGSGTGG